MEDSCALNMSKKKNSNPIYSHNDTLIKASGKYDIDRALEEHEEYPDDFESESGDEAEADENEMTLIMENYQKAL